MSEGIHDAIRTGDVAAVTRLLLADPALVHARPDGQRTLLHVATDWPGHLPRVGETITALIAQGADVNAKFEGGNPETPLHWAASNDDVAALDALLDHGAHIEAPGSVIDGGAPLADAVAFGQWHAARRLVERGASCTIWQAAALGLMDRLREHLASDPPPSPEVLTNAFWCACHGGQLAAARHLLDYGADRDWSGHDGLSPLDAALRNGSGQLVEWLRSQGAISAKQE